ncbi:MAG: FecR domain-containing protein [Myxococcota bacterium]
MIARSDPAERAADALRRTPPSVDDLTRARMERVVVEATRRELLAPPPTPRRRALQGALVGGAVVAVAAAALVTLWARGTGGDPATGTASLDASGAAKELMQTALVAEGMPAQGEALRTGSGQRMRAQIGASEVELEPNTVAQFERIAPEELRVRLRRGAVRVSFRPAVGSAQQMLVATEAARVEVVGTIFRVEVDGAGATGVWVDEGEVRVVPTAPDDPPQHVSAGKTLRVQASTPPIEGGEGATPEAAADGEDGDGERGADDADAAPEHAPGAGDGEVGGGPQDAMGRRAHVQGRVRDGSGGGIPGFGRARRLLNRQRYDAARRLLRGVADREGAGRETRARAWILIGESYEEQREHPEAAEAYGKASWLGAGTQPGLHGLFMLGRVREGRLGDARGARNAYRRYLQQAPAGPDAPRVRHALCRLGERSACR